MVFFYFASHLPQRHPLDYEGSAGLRWGDPRSNAQAQPLPSWAPRHPPLSCQVHGRDPHHDCSMSSPWALAILSRDERGVSKFNCIQRYSILFNCILKPYSTLFNCIQFHATVFNFVQLYWIVFDFILMLYYLPSCQVCARAFLVFGVGDGLDWDAPRSWTGSPT